MSEANKEIVRKYQEAYNTNNLDTLGELLAPHWKTNAWPEGAPQSLEMAKEVYQGILQSFPDIQFHTQQVVAEGEWVVQRHLVRGTFKGEMAGIPPTGKTVEVGGVSMFRIVDGKIVEHWGYSDDVGFWHQCGVEVPEIMLAFIHRAEQSGGDSA